MGDEREQPPRQVLHADRAGQKALGQEAAQWERLAAAISSMVRAV